MLRVYRGWIFTPESTEDKAIAQKDDELSIEGTYQEIVTLIDRFEYNRAEREIAR